MTTCPPRYGTPRNPDRATYGPAAAHVARALGVELDEWQRHVLDVALEVDDDRRLIHRTVVLSLGRQNGKTLLGLVAQLDRLLAGTRRGWGARQRALYGAQTGRSAREKVLDVWLPQVEASTLLGPALTKVTRSNGDEALHFGDAKVSVMPSSFTAGHGGTNDLVMIDEAFAASDDRVEVGARPTMLTRPSPQLWIVSAAGESSSTSPYWWSKVDDLRVRADSGEWGSLAGFEWSAPDDADRADPAVWRAVIPALAAGRITEDVVRAELDAMDDDVFDRTMLNRWARRGARLISLQAWARCRDPDATPGGTLHFAVDVCPLADNARGAAIVVCGRDNVGPVLEVVATGRGTSWLIDRIGELDRAHSPATWSVDRVGPVAAILGELRSTVGEKRLRVTTTSDACAAAQRLHDAIGAGEVRHRGQSPLDTAVAAAVKRPVGESWCWGRRDSAADVSSLVASGLAHLQCVRQPDSPLVIFGGR